MEPLKIWEAGEVTVTREKTIRRFAAKNLFQGFLDAIELDEGILYTIAGLFKHPGKIIRGYLDLDRLMITSPIRYFLFVEGISAFLTIRFNFWAKQSEGIYNLEEANYSEDHYLFGKTEFTELFRTVFLDYLSLWMAVAIFFISLFSTMFFKKSKFTYWEHFISNLFIFNQSTLIFLPVIIFSGLFETSSLIVVYFLVGYVNSIWTYKDLFDLSWGKSIIKGPLVQILGTLLFFGFFCIGLILVLNFN
jgi:hypothetical protein